MSRRDWIDEDEYPDDNDIERFGEYSPTDYDPLTIGRAGRKHEPFWTRTRIILAIIVFVLLLSFAVSDILPLFSR
jgi:uncharacterized membrane protein YkvA (DUF1232 family)